MSSRRHDDDLAALQAAHGAYWERLAVRDGVGQPWRWFGPPVLFRQGAHDPAAMRQLEDQAAEAVFYHRTGDICRVRASTTAAFDELDMSVLRGTADWEG